MLSRKEYYVDQKGLIEELVQGFELCFDTKARVINLPSFNKKDLPLDITSVLPVHGEYKQYFKELSGLLSEYTRRAVGRDDFLQFDDKHRVTFVYRGIVAQNRVNTVCNELQSHLEPIFWAEIYNEMHRALKWKALALHEFGQFLLVTRGERDQTVIADRLILLRDYEVFIRDLSSSISTAERIELFRAAHKAAKYFNQLRVIERQLVEAKTITTNARNGVFPGLYERAKIKAAINFYSGGLIKSRKEFDKERDSFPKAIQVLIPKLVVI